MRKVCVKNKNEVHIHHCGAVGAKRKNKRIEHLTDISEKTPKEKVALKIKILFTLALTFFSVSGVYWLTSHELGENQKLRKLAPSEQSLALYPFLHLFK